jgi:hypothetical protein
VTAVGSHPPHPSTSRPLAIAVTSLALVLVACAGVAGPSADRGSGNGVQDPPGGGGTAAATVRIGDETWELPNVACRLRTGGTTPLSLVASTGLIGLSLSELSLYVDILDDDGEGRQAGDGVVHQVVLTEGPLTQPTLHRRGTSGEGEMTISIDGQRVTARGTFDDALTSDVVEEVPGTVEANCGTIIADGPETSEAPATADGWVTVDGTTFEFTFGDPPLCNLPGNDGRLNGRGHLVDDRDRAVTFNYATAEMSESGNASMQIIIDGPDGNQLWYSAVGFEGIDDRGSIDSMVVDGNTATISGTLADGSDRTILAEFTAEATCDV